jgi:RNA polymerase sigma factor (sigma-70 family)
MVVPKGVMGVNGSVMVDGRRISVSALVEALGEGDVDVADAVVGQVRADRASGAGVSDVLTAVCTAYRPAIKRYLAWRLGGDLEAVEDVWSETLMRVYERIDEFDSSRAKFRTWVHRQAEWAGWDWLRTKAAWDRGDSVAVFGDSQALDPEWAHERELRSAAMRRAFARLTRQEQELLFLRHVLGCRHVEIARHRLVDDLPEEHVRVYANRATRRLGRLFHEESGVADSREETVPVDEQVSIAEVVEMATRQGELETLACLEADLEAARLGHALRASFERSMLDPALADRYGDELERLSPLGAPDDLTDEEVDALLDLG